MPWYRRMFAGLLPEGVITAWGDPREPSPPLLPAEEALVARAVPKRRAEFSRGRACARSVLSTLNVPEFALLSGPQREPVWPAGIVGSITHTEGLCAVAAARDALYAGIGIDAEPSQPLDEKLFEYVCLKDELVTGPDGFDLPRRARLIFSAKEAVYKCQFPLTRRFLEFHEVRVQLHSNSEFSVQVLADVPALAGGACFTGRFAERDGFLLTASWIRR